MEIPGAFTIRRKLVFHSSLKDQLRGSQYQHLTNTDVAKAKKAQRYWN